MTTAAARWPATELAAAIRGRTLWPVEAIQAVLRRIEQITPRINA